jgi:hypothetical protein
MADVIVTVPMRLWAAWIAEGDLPGDEAEYESHFWVPRPLPRIGVGERVYVAAFGRLRGYAPLYDVEERCQLDRRRHCLVRLGGAVAVTIDEPIPGFRGWRYRFWDRADEIPFPSWRTAGLPEHVRVQVCP